MIFDSFSRLRRYRTNHTIRRLTQDLDIKPSDFILPVFIQEQEGEVAIDQMPYAFRLGPQALIKKVELIIQKGILAIALFPVIDESKKSLTAEEAWNPEGLIPRAIKNLKRLFPELCIIADIALDPFHLGGQDGLCSEQGDVLNDLTLIALGKQALCYANAGADILAPSDMMDGRVGYIRKILEENQLYHTLILSYCTKFASHLYGPFRHAVDSHRFLGRSNKKTYQMDFKCRFQSILEYQADVKEGADFIMVKPGLHYLDVIQALASQDHALPIWAYHVSGECSLLWYGAEKGLFSFSDMLLETLWSFRRAGTSKIITYFAYEASLLLQ